MTFTQALPIIVVCGLLIGLAWAILRVPARVELTTDGGLLEVRLGPADRLLCLRAGLRVPLSLVRAVRVVDRDELPRPGLRWPGSYLPGVITAGSYGLGDKRTFWDIRRAERVLLVLLRPGAGYSALVLELPDPDAAAARLTYTLGRS